MERTKKKIIAAAAISAAVFSSVTGVLAYLTDSKEVTNTITIGSVAIELTEPSFKAEDYKAVCPNQKILKDPTVKNVGNSSAYIKLDVLVPTSKDGVKIVTPENTYGTTNELFTYEINEGWTQYGKSSIVEVEDNTYTKHSYVYDEELEPNKSTPALFNCIKLVNITGGQDVCGKSVDIPVTAYGIQSDGIEKDEAFVKYDEQAAIPDKP